VSGRAENVGPLDEPAGWLLGEAGGKLVSGYSRRLAEEGNSTGSSEVI